MPADGCDSKRKSIQPSDSNAIQRQLAQYGFKQVLLTVTQRCNLHCGCCLYSDAYPFGSDYSDARKSLQTAPKAVDYYLFEFARTRRRNPY